MRKVVQIVHNQPNLYRFDDKIAVDSIMPTSSMPFLFCRTDLLIIVGRAHFHRICMWCNTMAYDGQCIHLTYISNQCAILIPKLIEQWIC